jgi:hypothetical protein
MTGCCEIMKVKKNLLPKAFPEFWCGVVIVQIEKRLLI